MKKGISALSFAWPVGNRSFSVLFFSETMVCAGFFLRRREKRWQLIRSASLPVDQADPSKSWQEILKSIGHKDEMLLLTGTLADGFALSFASAALSPREQRGAVEMELPRHVFQLPESPRFQFAVSEEDAEKHVNVQLFLFPALSLDSLAARMTQSGCRADGFVYPFLAVKKEDPPIYLPGVEKDFLLQQGEWIAVSDPETAAAETKKAWGPLLRKWFIFRKLDLSLFLPMLVTARMFADGRFAKNRTSLNLLPEKLRSLRFRKVMIATIVLLILLVAGIFRHSGGSWLTEYRETKKMTAELKEMQSKITAGKRLAKRNAREQKERQKIFDGGSGNPDVIAELAILSGALPANVLVSSIRCNDGKIDLVLQSENDTLDLPSVINPLGRWKVDQLQQRQRGDSSVATITMTLIPLTREVK